MKHPPPTPLPTATSQHNPGGRHEPSGVAISHRFLWFEFYFSFFWTIDFRHLLAEFLLQNLRPSTFQKPCKTKLKPSCSTNRFSSECLHLASILESTPTIFPSNWQQLSTLRRDPFWCRISQTFSKLGVPSAQQRVGITYLFLLSCCRPILLSNGIRDPAAARIGHIFRHSGQ